MTEHTKGPWRWWTSNSTLRLSSDATRNDGDVLHAAIGADGVPHIVVSQDDMPLIAAAPELLSAAKDMSRILTVFRLFAGLDGTPWERVLKAKKVIAKAEGKEWVKRGGPNSDD